MRWLESAPRRYDAGMRWLTLGCVGQIHAAVAEAATARPGARVIEIGCGTGSVTAQLVARGAEVTALDQNPEMLEQARLRLSGAPAGAVTWLERTAAEVDQLAEAAFDAAVASLCLSEMSAGERAFVLRAAARRLRPGGILAVADEVRPRGAGQRLAYTLLRLPQAALAWLLAGSTSRPVRELADEIRAAGFSVQREQRWLLGSLAVVVAEWPQ
jgi:demethylmenaquinone methyltransferase/2-methoxy-6-polyprenyl-1,4-benzoquinol methylase